MCVCVCVCVRACVLACVILYMIVGTLSHLYLFAIGTVASGRETEDEQRY